MTNDKEGVCWKYGVHSQCEQDKEAWTWCRPWRNPHKGKPWGTSWNPSTHWGKSITALFSAEQKCGQSEYEQKVNAHFRLCHFNYILTPGMMSRSCLIVKLLKSKQRNLKNYHHVSTLDDSMLIPKPVLWNILASNEQSSSCLTCVHTERINMFCRTRKPCSRMC